MEKPEAVSRDQLRSGSGQLPGMVGKISGLSVKFQTTPKGLEAETDLRLDDATRQGVSSDAEDAVW